MNPYDNTMAPASGYSGQPQNPWQDPHSWVGSPFTQNWNPGQAWGFGAPSAAGHPQNWQSNPQVQQLMQFFQNFRNPQMWQPFLNQLKGGGQQGMQGGMRQGMEGMMQGMGNNPLAALFGGQMHPSMLYGDKGKQGGGNVFSGM